MGSIVLRGGRVIDPASGLDAVSDVLIEGGRVAAVGADLVGTDVLDVTGSIVGPGFIDLHSHVHSIAGHRLQAMDGVTTALDLEVGLMPVTEGYRRAARNGRPLNYGFSASWAAARGQVLCGMAPRADFAQTLSLLGDKTWQRSSTRAELAAWLELLRRELEAGALGIGVVVGYAPRSAPTEFLAVAALAAEAGVPTYTHVRELVEADDETPVDGSWEVVRAAAETGARMHHCHVNSTSRRHIDRVLQTIERSRNEGAHVTVEAYPYGAGSTGVGAAFLAPERLSAWGLAPTSIVLLPSGERIATEARLRDVRATAPETTCIVEFLDETVAADHDYLRRALTFPDAIVASDAMPVTWPRGLVESRQWPLPPGGATHPRTAGTFTRSLRLMVLETQSWTWSEAFRRCSWLPAQLLSFTQDVAGKGRIGAGSDADIVVLDPARLSDQATYLDPTRPSAGVRYLFVHGTAVVIDGELDAHAYPGRPVRGHPR